MYRTPIRAALGLSLLFSAAPAALAQCPEDSFQGNDTINGDSFGVALDASFPRLIVGASRDADDGANAGTAFVFRAEAGGFVQEVKLTGGNVDAGDQFGQAVAMTAAGALVGAPRGDGFGADTGHVHAFARIGTTWVQTGALNPGEGDPGDEFGRSIAIDGTRAVIGAPFAESTPGGPHGGAAYVFEFGGGNGWQFVTKLVPNDINGSPMYGYSVALAGDRIVVGAPHDNDGGFDAGAAYVFEESGGNWSLDIKLIATDFEPSAAFGWSVAAFDKDVMVGAPIATALLNRSGAAYFFTDESGSWTQDAKLFDPLGDSVDRFGYSVHLQGDKAIAGAPWAEPNGQSVGSAYVCERSGGAWSMLHAVQSPSTGPNTRRFGIAVQVEGGLHAVGDTSLDENMVHAFTLEGPDCNANGIPDACDITNGTSNDNNGNDIPDECDSCGFGNTCASGPNSTGAAAVMGATGSTSIAANDLVLQASPVPNQPGLFFYGPTDAFTPFGNGFRCVGAPFFRLPISVATGNTITTALDHSVAPTLGLIDPFSTWYFQCWYRDPAAGGAAFDLSDSLKIAFCP